MTDRFSCLVGAVFVTMLAACGGPSDGPPVHEAAVEGEGNEITVSDDTEKTQIDVYSESGIGRAALELIEGQKQEDTFLRFHLRGLEQLKFAYGDLVILLSISSSEGNAIHQSVVIESGEESSAEQIQPGSLYWMAVEILNSDGSSGKIPLEDGQIIVKMPREFSVGDYRSFAIDWIDFFR